MNNNNNKKLTSNKQNFGRKRKRVWNGVVPKKVTRLAADVSTVAPIAASTSSTPISCSSGRKLSGLSKPNDSPTTDIINDFYMFVHFGLLQEVFAVLNCPDCASRIEITNDPRKRKGFSHQLSINCTSTSCDWNREFATSPGINKTFIKRKSRLSDINVRSVIAFREIGCGHAPMTTFSTIMNTQCLSKAAFNNVNSYVMTAYKIAAEKSMQNAANEAPCIDTVTDLPCTRVSIDGSWQKRGHASMHGVVTAISGDKCVDFEVKSKYCHGCRMWEHKKGTPEYNSWFIDHDCSINHDKSSGAMESVGAVAVFNRSISKNKLIYKEYLGDGDTSSFNDVVKSQCL